MKHLKTKHDYPWTIGLASEHNALAVFPARTKLGTHGDAVCLISPMKDVTEQDESNAKLIAAAPELLAACIIVFELVAKVTYPTEQDLVDINLLMNDVIEKATK